MALPVPRGPGPWGGHGGMEWDDGVFPAIRELHLYVGDSVIYAIRVLYQSGDGEPVWSPKHGGEGGDPSDPVNKYIIITITMSLFKYEKKNCNYNSLTLYKDVTIPCMHGTLIC